MTRTPDGLTVRSKLVTLRLTPSMHAIADRLRGTATMSAYIRRLIQEDWARQNGSGK